MSRQRKAYKKTINDHIWFFRMNGRGRDLGLIGYYGEQKLSSGGIMIAKDIIGKTKVYKQFAYFSTIQEFLNHMAKFHPSDWNFYEIVGATTLQQKPYFDIDIVLTELLIPNTDPDETVVKVLLVIVKQIVFQLQQSYKIIIKSGDVSIYTTKYKRIIPIGNKLYPEKYSYHIVIQNYYFSDFKKMRVFGKHVKHKLGNPSCIDVIWGKSRQFRLLHSGKGNLDNEISPKEVLSFNERKEILKECPYLLNERSGNPLFDFLKSFVSIVNLCKLLE